MSYVPENHLTWTFWGWPASDVVWNQGGLDTPVVPLLQLEDGFFAGTASVPGGTWLEVFDWAGNIKWNKFGYEPVLAKPGGGLVARGTNGSS